MADFKPKLSLSRILQMNIGFLGLQFSFGLQQSNMGPIYSYLGASEAQMPLLWLAGPVTGLLVQPIIGAMSDSTLSRWGRRTPYFISGAIICSVCLLAMPLSAALWTAVCLLWILDAANNITMEPYRAYVADRLPNDQHSTGFLIQSAFTGLAQTLSYLSPSIFLLLGFDKNALGGNHIPIITQAAFITGAVLAIATIAWSVLRVPELPLSAEEAAAIRRRSRNFMGTLNEIWRAIQEMPVPMRQLSLMMFFQWYAMVCYWQYVTFSVARSLFAVKDSATPEFRDAVLINGQIGGFYNFVAFLAAFALIPLARRFGAKLMHSLCLCAAGAAMLAIPGIQQRGLLLIPMIGVGLGWASMMGNPYIMLAGAIPAERNGVYMGIFNMFIVTPMLIQGVTLPLYYSSLLQGDPRNVLRLAGILLIAAAAATLFVSANTPVRRTLAETPT